MSKRSYINDVYKNLIKPHLSEREIEEYELPLGYEIKSKSGKWLMFVDKSIVSLWLYRDAVEGSERVERTLYLDSDPTYNTDMCVEFLNELEEYGGSVKTVSDVRIIEKHYDGTLSNQYKTREEIYSLGLPYILYIFHRNENVIMQRNVKNVNNDLYMNRYLGGE